MSNLDPLGPSLTASPAPPRQMYQKRNANSIQPSHKLAAAPPLLQSASNKGLGFQAKAGLLFASGLFLSSCNGRSQNSYDTLSATAPHGPHTAEWRQRPVPASSLWRHLYLKTQNPLWVWGDQPAIDKYAMEPLRDSGMGYFHTLFGWVKVLSTGGATLCHIATLADQQGRTLILCPSTAIKTPRA